MLARRRLMRRINDALSAASPLALADAMDAYVCARSPQDVHEMIRRSFKRLDSGERAQLQMYVNVDAPDDLVCHRFSAFLRQNPRAIAALEPQDVDAILQSVGELPPLEHNERRLPARTVAVVAAVVLVTLLPLAAQYLHQRGLLEGLTEPVIPPAIVPFVQPVTIHHAAVRSKPPHTTIARHKVPAHRHRSIAYRPRHASTHRSVAVKPYAPAVHQVAWKFDRRNNPYFNRERWHHPYVEPKDISHFGQRARLSVASYLHAVRSGNLTAALVHLGLPRTASTSAIAELPIVSSSSRLTIVGSKKLADGSEQVQADIVTRGREYFEIFSVAHDGPATRIVEHYYIPVNRSAQIAERSTRPE